MTKAIIGAMGMILITASASLAQLYPLQRGDLAASIPFAFEANAKTMQAGEYIVRADAEHGRLYICEDGVYCTTLDLASLASGQTEGPLQLIFTRHAGRYHLSQVLSDQGESDGLSLLPTTAAGDEVERVKARRLVIHEFKGLPTAWS